MTCDFGLETLDSIGYKGVPSKVTIDTKKSILRSIFLKSKERMIPFVEQLVHGMQLYDLLSKIRQKPLVSLKLFSITENIFEWTYQEFCVSISPEYSEDGSNYKNKEIDVFKMFLDAMEVIANNGKNHFNHPLKFWNFLTLSKIVYYSI